MLFTVFLIAVALCVAWYGWEKSHRRTYPMSGGLHSDISLPYEEEFELYHNGLSLCSKKVRVCLAELGIAYREHQIDLVETGSYEVISRHFLKVNPAGLVPVLVHKGHPIYESHDIIRYCAEQSATSLSLIPEGESQLSLMEIWVDRASLKGEDPLAGVADSAANCVAVLTVPLFAAMMHEIPARRLLEGLLFHRIKFRPFMFLILKLRGLRKLPSVKPLMAASGQAQAAMAVHLDQLEQHLSEQGDDSPWICGTEYTLADISWMVIFERMLEADWLEDFVRADLRPAIYDYWMRLQARPGYAGIANYRLPAVAQGTSLIRQLKAEDAEFLAAFQFQG
jgi:glutathione S-transferase